MRLLRGSAMTRQAFAQSRGMNSPSPGAIARFCFHRLRQRRWRNMPVWPGQPMTAHWGVPDPAEAEGTEAEIALAFKDAYRMLSQRIGNSQRADPLARSTDAANQTQRNRAARDVIAGTTQRAEYLGTAFLLATVVGSGIMAARLSGGNGALALLCNTLPTGAILTVLILTFGPISGAHFNPAVSIAFALHGDTAEHAASIYIAAQVVGADRRRVDSAYDVRTAAVAILGRLSERARPMARRSVATIGLLLTISGAARTRRRPYAVGLYMTIGVLVHGLHLVRHGPAVDDRAFAVRAPSPARAGAGVAGVSRGPARRHVCGLTAFARSFWRR